MNVPGAYPLLAFAPIGLIFTAFAVAGIANSVNIVDWFDSLAGDAGAISWTT